jgi:cytochrome c553
MKTYVLAAMTLAAGSAFAADPATIDWSKVAATSVTLFYPGQSSYEWLRNDHKKGKGAKAVENGQACVRCHEDEEKDLGAALV